MVPIQSVHGCGTGMATAPIVYSLEGLLGDFLAANAGDTTLELCIADFTATGAYNLSGGVSTLGAAALSCIDQPNVYLQVSWARPAHT